MGSVYRMERVLSSSTTPGVVLAGGEWRRAANRQNVSKTGVAVKARPDAALISRTSQGKGPASCSRSTVSAVSGNVDQSGLAVAEGIGSPAAQPRNGGCCGVPNSSQKAEGCREYRRGEVG